MPRTDPPHKLLRRAARRGDGASTADAWREIIDRDMLLNFHHEAARAILGCRDGAAAAMLEGLREVAQHQHAPHFRSQCLLGAPMPGQKIKILAVLFTAGFDLGRETMLTFSAPTVRHYRARLGELSGSHHASLEAMRLEPDPTDVVARPWWKTFHGVETDRFRGDRTVWQRFILPTITFDCTADTARFWLGVAALTGSAILALLP